ncbi:MAG: tetratricopeptide repeat protein [Verrucomicrobiia bacterium]|jgi:tetratricopeptide (TPR) repeat protein/ribonuclease BN (tRNA processing enzyme)
MSKQTDATDEEFKKLFWAVRKEHVRLKKKATANDPAHKAAVAFAQAHNWKWAEELVETSRLGQSGKEDEALKAVAACEASVPEEYSGHLYFIRGSALDAKGDHDEAIKAYRKALAMPGFDKPGSAWGNIGLALDAKGDHDEAIKAFHKALAVPGYDKPGKAWVNIGIALHAKGDYEEAIKAFHKALAVPGYDKPGNIWIYIGLALDAKGDHDEAIKAYHKALAVPGFDTPGGAWNNIGVALHTKGDHDEAIKAYRKALADPGFDTPAMTWANLGLTYIKAGKSELAREACNKALAAPDPSGSDHARARMGLGLLESKLKPAALSADDRALVEKSLVEPTADNPEARLIGKIKEAGDTQYDRYLTERKDSKRDDTLSILRGWSSAVTLLEGSERRWRGGGYFLKWRGCGIVIDPGFDFLRNFHDAGFHGREINVVVVSHNHPDHNDDLKPIDDLRYEIYKRRAAQKGAGVSPYVILWDEDTKAATKFSAEHPEHHHPPITFSTGYPQPFDLSKHPAKFPVRVAPFKVKHSDDAQSAMGVMIELLDQKGGVALRIGYTGDTAYFDDLPIHLSKCDVLIAHISQPTIDELLDPAKRKKEHLGYRGTAALVKECKPKLVLLAEFWAGYTDIRIDLVKGLRMRSGCEAILPTGIGMHLHLPDLKVECTACHQQTAISQVNVTPPTDDFGNLAYLCPTCLLR